METRPSLDRCVDIIKSAKEREEYRELEFQATRAAPRERDSYSNTMIMHLVTTFTIKTSQSQLRSLARTISFVILRHSAHADIVVAIIWILSVTVLTLQVTKMMICIHYN